MKKVKLTPAVIEDLKQQAFTSVLVTGASNPAELKNNPESRLQASKEPVPEERVTQNGFHVAIDDPALIDICNSGEVFIEIP